MSRLMSCYYILRNRWQLIFLQKCQFSRQIEAQHSKVDFVRCTRAPVIWPNSQKIYLCEAAPAISSGRKRAFKIGFTQTAQMLGFWGLVYGVVFWW